MDRTYRSAATPAGAAPPRLATMCGRFALFSDPDRFAQFLDAEVALDPGGLAAVVEHRAGPRDVLGA